jgi:hypothetical protein
LASGGKKIAEYHLNNKHGCAKVEYAIRASYWGEYKEDKREGYGTEEWPNGNRYFG